MLFNCTVALPTVKWLFAMTISPSSGVPAVSRSQSKLLLSGMAAGDVCTTPDLVNDVWLMTILVTAPQVTVTPVTLALVTVPVPEATEQVWKYLVGWVVTVTA